MSAGVETVLSNALAPRDEADLAEAVVGRTRGPFATPDCRKRQQVRHRSPRAGGADALDVGHERHHAVRAVRNGDRRACRHSAEARGRDVGRAWTGPDLRAAGLPRAAWQFRRTNDRCGCCRQSVGPATHHGRGVPGQPDRRSHGQWPGAGREIRRTGHEKRHRARSGEAERRLLGHARGVQRSHLQSAAHDGAGRDARAARTGRSPCHLRVGGWAGIAVRGLGCGASAGVHRARAENAATARRLCCFGRLPDR